MTTQQDYTASFNAELEKLRESEAQDNAGETATDQQADATGQTSEQTDATTAVDEEKGEGAAAPAASPEAKDQGDVRGALRASRRAERQARERAERLEAELEEARKRIPKPADENLTDDELAELEADVPLVAKALKAIRAAAPVTTAAPAPAPTPDEPEFMPVAYAPEIQDLIDDIPDLLAMQNNPDQGAFQLAIQTDALLQKHPAWSAKPLAERLAECTRRVKAELAPAPQPPAPAPAPQPNAQRRQAAAVVKEAPRAQPTTLSDLSAGGSAPTKPQSDLAAFMKMSNEDMLNALRDD